MVYGALICAHLLTAHALGNGPQQRELQRCKGRALVCLGVWPHGDGRVALHDLDEVAAVGLKRWQVDDEGRGVDFRHGVAYLCGCPRGAETYSSVHSVHLSGTGRPRLRLHTLGTTNQ